VTLGQKVASHLALAADLLALGLKLLPPLLALSLELLTIRGAVVDAVDAAIGHPRLPFDMLRPRLLALHSRLALDALRPCLMALGSRLTFRALRPCLMALGSRLTLDTLRARLMTFGPRLTFRALRPCLMALGALHARSTLRPLLVTLRPLGMLPATATLHRSGLAVIAASMRPRIRRGCDRQRGDAGCEKNPGHRLSPSNGINGPFAAPFQRLNGWNLHTTALA
jgi:hypothetical protein